MRGIHREAADHDYPIKGSDRTCAQIANKADRCFWYANSYGIDCTRDGAQAYYDSIVELYAEWGIDFIKADDMNSWDGEGQKYPYHVDEIEALATAIARCGRGIVLSLSPGAALLCNAHHLRRHANMWPVSFDFWDDWQSLKAQFQRLALWSSYVIPGAWPDADMLPFGRVGIRGEIGQNRESNFTPDELRTMLTLWAICRSPLMIGGHLPASSDESLAFLRNPEVLEVNQRSVQNRQVEFVSDSHTVWEAEYPQGGSLVALFNLSDEDKEICWPLKESCSVRDLWSRSTKGMVDSLLRRKVPPHGAVLYLFKKIVFQVSGHP